MIGVCPEVELEGQDSQPGGKSDAAEAGPQHMSPSCMATGLLRRCRQLCMGWVHDLIGWLFVYGTTLPCISASELRAKLDQHRYILKQQSIRQLFIITTIIIVFYALFAGWDSPILVFERTNNVITWVLVGMAVPLARICSGKNEIFFNMLFLLALIHYAFFATLTRRRAIKLLRVFVDVEDVLEDEDKEFEEAYGVVLSVIGLMMVSSCMCVRLRCYFICLVVTSLLWWVQVKFLGTCLTETDTIRLGVAYHFVLLMTYLAARRTFISVVLELEGRLREIRGVMHIMQNSSAPIALISMRTPTDGKQGVLEVDLWNESLQSMTRLSVPKGTALRDVRCLRAEHLDLFEASVNLALSEQGVQTKRMLLPLVAAAGLVWLQVDVWPVHFDGLKAMVIGSDVTEFVTKYHSFLMRHGSSSDIGQRRDRPCLADEQLTGKGAIAQSALSALMDPCSMRLTNCSVHLSILFQCQMEGQSLLSFIHSQDEIANVRDAAAAARYGGGPQEVAVTLCLNRPFSRHRERRRRKLEHGEAKKRGNMEVEVFLHVAPASSLPIDAGCRNEGLLAITLHSFGFGKARCESDPGVTTQTQREAAEEHSFGSRPVLPEVCTKAHSDGGEWLSQRLNRSRPSEKEGAASQGHHPSATSPAACGEPVKEQPTSTVSMEALTAHLIELTRHLGSPTFAEARHLLQCASIPLHELAHRIESRLAEPCKDWQCEFCNAFNDAEDEVCEVCKISMDHKDCSEDTSSLASTGDIPELLESETTMPTSTVPTSTSRALLTL